MPFLEFKNVAKGFGPDGARSDVLKDINLAIEKGEFVAIVGFSGAGKTTLISLIAGLLKADSGTVTVNDLEITGPGPDRGIVFQNYSLLPWLAVDPQVLLLDEPLSALDALTRATLQDEISLIWQQDRKTVVIITNDPDEGIYLADRIIPLSSGPAARLGPSIPIDIPRPRDRKALNHDRRFKEIRRDVIEFLLNSKRSHPRASVTKKLVLPDLQPEDLTVSRLKMGGRRRP